MISLNSSSLSPPTALSPSTASKLNAARHGSQRPGDRFVALPVPDPFPFRSNAELWVTGSLTKGGVALIRDGDHHAKVILTPAVFAVLSLLIIAARRAVGRKPWTAAGFISVTHLGRELERWSPNGAADQVPRHIHTLHTELMKAWRHNGSHKQAKQWAYHLIESDHLGYRISTRADRQHLDIVQERPLKILVTEPK